MQATAVPEVQGLSGGQPSASKEEDYRGGSCPIKHAALAAFSSKPSGFQAKRGLGVSHKGDGRAGKGGGHRQAEKGGRGKLRNEENAGV